MERYSIITSKNPREILLLRGSGCKWRRCAFCDYHLDFAIDEESNFELNRTELAEVVGVYGKLEIINSGSFVDLDSKTMNMIIDVCINKSIKEIHFESHWMHRGEIDALRKRFALNGIDVKLKIGVETFDCDYRENVLMKGLDEKNPEKIAEYYDEVCLLMGLTGQTEESMRDDIETGLKYFERVCVNIMVENGTRIKPDLDVINIFRDRIYADYIHDGRVDILMQNTDFGVG